jgi:hypothetical protein
MFKDAVRLATAFTRPLVISRKTVSGACGAAIGTFVVVNSEGWIVTAGHNLRQLHQLQDECQITKSRPASCLPRTYT